MNKIYHYETSLGTVALAENGQAITYLFFPDTPVSAGYAAGYEPCETPLLRRAYAQLQDYLDGKRTEFDLPLAPQGTVFQQKVWNALLSIPYGHTRSYADIAAQVGNRKACRAVGLANGKNPISIFIPCHRVVGSNGALTGYGGGLDRKRQLLALEGIEL